MGPSGRTSPAFPPGWYRRDEWGPLTFEGDAQSPFTCVSHLLTPWPPEALSLRPCSPRSCQSGAWGSAWTRVSAEDLAGPRWPPELVTTRPVLLLMFLAPRFFTLGRASSTRRQSQRAKPLPRPAVVGGPLRCCPMHAQGTQTARDPPVRDPGSAVARCQPRFPSRLLNIRGAAGGVCSHRLTPAFGPVPKAPSSGNALPCPPPGQRRSPWVTAGPATGRAGRFPETRSLPAGARRRPADAGERPRPAAEGATPHCRGRGGRAGRHLA